MHTTICHTMNKGTQMLLLYNANGIVLIQTQMTNLLPFVHSSEKAAKQNLNLVMNGLMEMEWCSVTHNNKPHAIHQNCFTTITIKLALHSYQSL